MFYQMLSAKTAKGAVRGLCICKVVPKRVKQAYIQHGNQVVPPFSSILQSTVLSEFQQALQCAVDHAKAAVTALQPRQQPCCGFGDEDETVCHTQNLLQLTFLYSEQHPSPEWQHVAMQYQEQLTKLLQQVVKVIFLHRETFLLSCSYCAQGDCSEAAVEAFIDRISLLLARQQLTSTVGANMVNRYEAVCNQLLARNFTVYLPSSSLPRHLDRSEIWDLFKACPDRDLREHVYRTALCTRAEALTHSLDKLARERHNLAVGSGYSSWGDMQLKGTLAGSPSAAAGFLCELLERLHPLVMDQKAAMLQQLSTDMQPWDEEFALQRYLHTSPPPAPSWQQLSPHFTISACFKAIHVILGAMGLGLHPQEVCRGESWIRGVQKFAVVHEAEGLLGHVYVSRDEGHARPLWVGRRGSGKSGVAAKDGADGGGIGGGTGSTQSRSNGPQATPSSQTGGQRSDEGEPSSPPGGSLDSAQGAPTPRPGRQNSNEGASTSYTGRHSREGGAALVSIWAGPGGGDQLPHPMALRVLFHEMGHALDMLLAWQRPLRPPLPDPLDFAEVCSQLMEMYAMDARLLRLVTTFSASTASGGGTRRCDADSAPGSLSPTTKSAPYDPRSTTDLTPGSSPTTKSAPADTHSTIELMPGSSPASDSGHRSHSAPPGAQLHSFSSTSAPDEAAAEGAQGIKRKWEEEEESVGTWAGRLSGTSYRDRVWDGVSDAGMPREGVGLPLEVCERLATEMGREVAVTVDEEARLALADVLAHSPPLLEEYVERLSAAARGGSGGAAGGEEDGRQQGHRHVPGEEGVSGRGGGADGRCRDGTKGGSLPGVSLMDCALRISSSQLVHAAMGSRTGSGTSGYGEEAQGVACSEAVEATFGAGEGGSKQLGGRGFESGQGVHTRHRAKEVGSCNEEKVVSGGGAEGGALLAAGRKPLVEGGGKMSLHQLQMSHMVVEGGLSGVAYLCSRCIAAAVWEMWLERDPFDGAAARTVRDVLFDRQPGVALEEVVRRAVNGEGGGGGGRAAVLLPCVQAFVERLK